MAITSPSRRHNDFIVTTNPGTKDAYVSMKLNATQAEIFEVLKVEAEKQRRRFTVTIDPATFSAVAKSSDRGEYTLRAVDGELRAEINKYPWFMPGKLDDRLHRLVGAARENLEKKQSRQPAWQPPK